jgi:hypothetical protein
MSSHLPLWGRLALAFTLTLGSVMVRAATDVRVFPVQAFFYDATADSKLDPRFRARVDALKPLYLSSKIHDALAAALQGKVGPLTQGTVGHTFAASFHVTRATSFTVDKGNGNSDVVASVTASLYFTNVVSGEILTTISRSVVSRSVVAKNASGIDTEKEKLFGQSLDTLMDDLVQEAVKTFSPTVVEAKVIDRAGDLLVLDAGYAKGIQTGDALNDSANQLIDIVYSGQHYSVAQRVLADNAGPGAVFQKYLPHAADGKDRPRTLVLVESLPNGFARDYIVRLFSELLGNTAPLTMVQVNTGFSQLVSTVVQQANLSLHSTAKRQPPGLFIRLRIAEPIVYEAKTNLDFKTIRHYETLAFADIVDSSGRVNFSVMGKDVIDDSITSNIGAGFEERREVSIKNALTDLAHKLANLTELKRDTAAVMSSNNVDAIINSTGKVYALQQKGVLLRKAKVQFGKETRELLIPVTGASVELAGAGQTRLSLGLPFDTRAEKIKAGDVFEVQRLGAAPRSAQPFTVCGPSESLGAVPTPSLMELAGHAIGLHMPGMFYVPEMADLTREIVGPATGFASAVTWKIPSVGICIQPVDRVNVSDEQCATSQCERHITARYTLRVKSSEEVLSRITFEGQFKSTGYFKSTSPQNVKRLIDADLIDEAQNLIEKSVEKIVFPAIN